MNTTMQSHQSLLTIQDVARLLHCSTRTVHRLKTMGELPAPVRVRSLLRWRLSDIESFISQSMETPLCSA